MYEGKKSSSSDNQNYILSSIMRIVNGCAVGTEPFVTRVTVRHHEVCRVMQNSYPEWRNFQFAPNNHYSFFFLQTLPLKIVFVWYALFYQFYAEISTFSTKKCSVWLLSTTSWRLARGRLTPLNIRRKYPELVKIAENLVGYARKMRLVQRFEYKMTLCIRKRRQNRSPTELKMKLRIENKPSFMIT